jgi:uncharacterized protein (TIGR02646 family)
MRYIRKEANNSPQAFEEWKNQENPKTWEDLPSRPPTSPEEDICYYSKSELRGVLLQEQGFLCCYCQQQIPHNERTVIEHLKPKSNPQFQHLLFDYTNLLACCHGIEANESTRVTPSFCGHRKDNEVLSVEPTQPDCASYFNYTFKFDPENPKVEIDVADLDEIHRHSIEGILGLNEAKLCNMRGAVLSAVIFDENKAFLDVESMQMLLDDLKSTLQKLDIAQEAHTIKLKPFHLAQIQILEELI